MRPLRPQDVLSLQADLRSGLDQPAVRRYLGGWLRYNEVLQEAPVTTAAMDRVGGIFADAQAWGLERSPAYYVDADAVALVRRAAADLPLTYTLEHHTPPSPHGFLVYAVPMTTTDRHGRLVAHRAISWTSGEANQLGGAAPAGNTGAVQVCQWTHLDDEDDYTTQLTQEYGRADLERRLGGRLQLSHTAPIPYGLPLGSWDAYREARASTAHMATNLIEEAIAVWLLMRQPLAAQEEVPQSPHRVRRWQRRGIPGSVSTVALRQRVRTPATQEGDGTRPEWSCRWVVDGHWHRYRTGTGRAQTEWRYVHDYVKGPEDQPLVIRPRVRVVRGDGPQERPA